MDQEVIVPIDERVVPIDERVSPDHVSPQTLWWLSCIDLEFYSFYAPFLLFFLEILILSSNWIIAGIISYHII